MFSGPSGTGKGTILSGFNAKYGSYGTSYSISATTRQPRDGELEGVNYYYKSHEEFQDMIKNDELLEWAAFCDNSYGTPKKPVMDSLAKGTDIILEIETIGAMNVKKQYPEAVLIFVLPPSLSELKKRLAGRGSETEDTLNKRFNTAVHEISYADNYDYIIVNDDIDKAIEDFKSIVDAERLKVCKNKNTIIEVCEK